jgi:3-oxoacyl-(acyl-carrier-protein) synthase
MNLRIAGMGWVTPFGRGIDPVWNQLLAGKEATPQSISDSVSKKSYSAFRVPSESLAQLPPHPRLRRASAISKFAAAAGLDAISEAESRIGKVDPERTALVFAASNGGVVYTKRFYQGIVESGAQSASPLLFPETVFNAPASHLAAILGINGASYTVVADGAVGVLAIKMAKDLLENESLDFVLVVGAEEADWILCDAYDKWRLIRKEPPLELFRARPRGTILSEGAGALVLARAGAVEIEAVDCGGNFARRSEANAIVRGIAHRLATDDGCVIASANGTFVDLAERDAIKNELPGATVYSLKSALGESVGASALWQVIAGAQALKTNRLPPVAYADLGSGLKFPNSHALACRTAIVLSCGLNQQAAGLRLRI